jgi:hypothetical protein
MIDYLGPMYSDTQMDAVSIQHQVLINVCLHARKIGSPTVRLIEDKITNTVLAQLKQGDAYETFGDIPSEIPILRRTRFVTNSKGIADNRLPIGELTIPLPNQILHIKVTKDESRPQNLLEFTVSEGKS